MLYNPALLINEMILFGDTLQRRIKDDALAEDLARFYVDQGCVDVDIIIEQYDKYLSDLLDKHAPKKHIYVVDRPLNEWMTDDILKLKAIRRKNELIWRENSYYNKL